MDVGVDVEEDVGGLWADGPTDDECMRPLSRPGGPGGQSLKRKSGRNRRLVFRILAVENIDHGVCGVG